MIEQRVLSDLIPYARNARTHSDAQVAQIAGSIREFGFNNPVLVDGANGIIAGHGRVLAARKLRLGHVPVIELAHLSEAQKRAYILADNRLAENAGWDRDLLSLELGDLSTLNIDLGDLGFDGAELDALFEHGAADAREEETPEPPVNPVSRPGDLWRLGPHRLLCGDATDANAVKRLLDGITPHLMITPYLMVTDPPYGVGSCACRTPSSRPCWHALPRKAPNARSPMSASTATRRPSKSATCDPWWTASGGAPNRHADRRQHDHHRRHACATGGHRHQAENLRRGPVAARSKLGRPRNVCAA